MASCSGCDSWCPYKNVDESSGVNPGFTWMVDERRHLTGNTSDEHAPTTSLFADIMAILKTYAKLDVCSRIIFAYHSNGNESRHSVIHRGTGNKRVPFWRGLLSRSLLHSVLRYDFSQDAMLTRILSASGLPTFSSSVMHSFDEQAKLRKHTWKRSKDPAATKKRKLQTLVRRRTDRMDRNVEGGDVHVPGVEYNVPIDDNDVPLKRARKSGEAMRCGLCQEYGHNKSVCDFVGAPIQPENSNLPVLNTSSEGLTELQRGPFGDIILLIDVEATSGNVYTGEIIQLAVSAHEWPTMKPLTVRSGFSSFMQYAEYTGRLNPRAVALLPHMDWDAVENAGTFKQLMKDFSLFISRILANYPNRRLLICGHNILNYDVPILFHCCRRIQVDLFKLLSDLRIVGFVDTFSVVIAKPMMKGGAKGGRRRSLDSVGDAGDSSVLPAKEKKDKANQPLLYSETCAVVPFDGVLYLHNADSDIKALCHIILHCPRPGFERLRTDQSWTVVVDFANVAGHVPWTKVKYDFKNSQRAKHDRLYSMPNFILRVIPGKVKEKAGNQRVAKRGSGPKRGSLSRARGRGVGRGSRRGSTRRKTVGKSMDHMADPLSDGNQSMTSDERESTSDESGTDSASNSSKGSEVQMNEATPAVVRGRSLRSARFFDEPNALTKEVESNVQPRLRPMDSNATASTKLTVSSDIFTIGSVTPLKCRASQSSQIIELTDATVDDVNVLELNCVVSSRRTTLRALLTAFQRDPCLLGGASEGAESDVWSMALLLRSAEVLADERAFVTTPSGQQVQAMSLRRLLPPIDSIDGAMTRHNFLNDDIINCYGHFLSVTDPSKCVLTTWISERLRRNEDLGSISRYLRKVDWNNNLFFFPVHHPADSHWTLVSLEWVSGNPGEWHICHEDSIDDGQRGSFIVDRIQALVKYYLNNDYPLINSANTASSGRSAYVRIMNKAELARKQAGRYVTLRSTWVTQQTDYVNCGCYVLHRIESAIAGIDRTISVPTAATYMQLYRNRVMLTLCDARLNRK